MTLREEGEDFASPEASRGGEVVGGSQDAVGRQQCVHGMGGTPRKWRGWSGMCVTEDCPLLDTAAGRGAKNVADTPSLVGRLDVPTGFRHTWGSGKGL